LKFFENFARQFPEKDAEEMRGRQMAETGSFNIAMNAISVSVRLRVFSKNGAAVPKVLCTHRAGKLAFKP
jgi:hypothetical protein